MRRKNIICIVLTAVMLLSAGCNRSTVDDAVAIDASGQKTVLKRWESQLLHVQR